MDGTRMVLVRHGESRAQQMHTVGGHDGCTGLSDQGRRQAQALARRLSDTAELADASVLYASFMARAVETASIIAGAVGGGLDVVQECDFCEFHPGEADGLSWREQQSRWPMPTPFDADHRRAPGSETWNEMAERVGRGLDAVVDRHPGETIVIVCHGGVIIQALARWIGLDLSSDASPAWFDPANTSLTECRLGSSPHSARSAGLKLVRYNDHAHLLSRSDGPLDQPGFSTDQPSRQNSLRAPGQ
jgi:probable phosphoglycerate mutase